MQKRFIVVDSNEIDQVVRENQRDRRPRNRDAEGAPVVIDTNNVWGAMSIGIFNSKMEAEEWVEGALKKNPMLKYMLLETVSFMEAAPSPMLRKTWNEAGELIVAG